MPDYDPKKIPILDDIIEYDDNEKRDSDPGAGHAEALDTEPDAASYVTENNLDLFATEAIDLASEEANTEAAAIEAKAISIADTSIEYTISPSAEPQIGEIDNTSIEDGYLHGRTVVEQGDYPEVDVSRTTQEPLPRNSETLHRDNIPLYSPANAAEEETEKFESALIDYNALDEAEVSTIDMPATDLPVINKQPESQPFETTQQTSTTNSLQSITDDIVKQLMPELEQQLRLLIQQALKEKLPEETTRATASSSTNIDSY